MEYMFYYMPSAPNKILGECYQGKVNFSDKTTFFFSKKKKKKNSTSGCRTVTPRKIVPWKIAPTIKFPQKVVARTQVNFPERVLQVN